MTQREVFKLVVRLMGVGLVIAGMLDLFAIVLWMVHLPTRPGYTPLQVIAAAAVYLITGVIVILASNLFTRLIYGRGE